MILTEQQFGRMRRLALSLAGIDLLERHRELLAHRYRRSAIRDRAGLDAWLASAEDGDTAARQEFLCLLTTKFTGFFRHPHHFVVAARHAMRVVGESGRARLWSAAVATGEEPWSLGMALVEAFRQEDPKVRILATDIDVKALAVAKRGEYGEVALGSLDPGRRERFFSPNASGHWVIAPFVRRLVEFRSLNLVDVIWPIEGPFDVIFCRNVLMYLEVHHRYAVLERIASILAPEGLLIVDPAENLGNAAHWFQPKEEGIYSRRRGSRIPGRGAMERG
ncbi:MAG: protein-glutamate O-methyltransferase CheR [Limisphaerales bacterium]